MWKNIVTIHSILKEKNYKTKFLTSLILKKKINKDEKRKKCKKNKVKKTKK
jgi:hypothetical protein